MASVRSKLVHDVASQFQQAHDAIKRLVGWTNQKGHAGMNVLCCMLDIQIWRPHFSRNDALDDISKQTSGQTVF